MTDRPPVVISTWKALNPTPYDEPYSLAVIPQIELGVSPQLEMTGHEFLGLMVSEAVDFCNMYDIKIERIEHEEEEPRS